MLPSEKTAHAILDLQQEWFHGEGIQACRSAQDAAKFKERWNEICDILGFADRYKL